MSLLTVAQAVAEEIGLPAPDTMVGATDDTVKQILRMINRTGKKLAKKNWSVLQNEHTFSLVAGTAYYDLPSDYDRMIVETAWDRTTYWSLRGQLTPREWQIRKSGLVATVSTRLNFRIKPLTRVNKFYVDPTPTSTDSLVFEYISSKWVRDAGNANGKTAYALDDDVALISEELLELGAIWRMLDRKGFAYAEAKDEYDREVDNAYAEDGGALTLDMGAGRVTGSNLPEGNFTL